MTVNGADMGLPFMKMHGLGNDFVVIDSRRDVAVITPDLAQALADRHRGIGFDQLAIIEEDQPPGPLNESNDPLPEAERPHVVLRFLNADGSVSAACGNATRCIARWVMDTEQLSDLRIRTERGLLRAVDAGNGLTSVNMGQPQLGWREIPLAKDLDTLHLPVEGDPVATGMGNPHCTFFVADTEAVDLEARGAEMEHHPLYPERTNVQFAHLIAPDHLRMRVWERGVGVTLASGSSSCAVAVAAARRGLTGRTVKIALDGGEITVDWREDGVWMTGPTTHVFTGTITPEFLETL